MSTKAKLTCSLTGQTRQSSHKYIAKKAEQYGISSEVFQEYYTCKPAYLEFKQALENEGVDKVLAAHDMNKDTASKILQYNGKSRKTLDDFKAAEYVKKYNTPAETSEETSTESEEVPALV